MFGNSILDFTLAADGATGNIIAVNLQNSYVNTVVQVQMKSTAGVYSTPSIAGVTLQQLFTYLNSSGAPDFAFSQQGPIVYVFLKASAYPLVNTNRVGIWWLRNVIPVASTADFIDVPPPAVAYLEQLMVRNAQVKVAKRVELDITNSIVRQKYILKLQ